MVADDHYVALLTSDPRKSFFGIPIQGDTIGYVVDCDTTMLPRYHQLAALTRAVNEALGQTSRRFGIVQALGSPRGPVLPKVYEPSSDLVGARTMLDSQPTGGETDLPEALAVTEGWYADQIFLVLSKHIDEDEIALLAQHTQQSGAVTHVIAFGQAAQLDLSPISRPTGGQFVRVSDRVLSDLASRAAR